MTEGIITFSFDDGSPGWMLGAKILEKYGFKGTFNVAVNFIRKRTNELVVVPLDRTIHQNNLITLQKRGHEIACHGLRHVNLRRCNDVELHYELVGSKRILTSLGLNVTSFTCPFNAYTTEIKTEALKHYTSFRVECGVNSLPVTKNYYRVFHGSPLKECKDAVKDAVRSNKWVVLLFHNVKKDNTDPFSFDAGEFEELVSFVADTGVPVRKVNEMIP